MPFPRFTRLAPPAQHGLTLVEIMVAVAILGILASIAAPALQDVIVQSRLGAEANTLVDAIQVARSEAIKRNQGIQFCRAANSSSSTCVGSKANWDSWIVVSTSGAVLRRGRTNDNLRLSSTLPLDSVSFIPDGTSNVSANLNTLTVCSPSGNGNRSRVIEIGVAGRTSVTRLAGNCA